MAISFFQRIGRAVIGKSRVDDDTLDAIEEALVESDMGVDTTLKVIDNLEERVEKDKYMSFDELVGLLRDEISQLIPETGAPVDFSKKPYVILVVGVTASARPRRSANLRIISSPRARRSSWVRRIPSARPRSTS